jgi:hypothetical protein
MITKGVIAMATEPLLSRFATALPTRPHPPLRQDPETQMTEVKHQGAWVSVLNHAELVGYGETKTAVQQESTDYR